MVCSRGTGGTLKRKWVNWEEGVCGCKAGRWVRCFSLSSRLWEAPPPRAGPLGQWSFLPKAARPWLREHLQPSCLAGASSPQGLRPRFCHRAGGQAGPASPLWPARVQGRLTGAVNGGPQELPSVCIRPTEPAATAAPASRCHCRPSGGPGAQDQAALCQPRRVCF